MFPGAISEENLKAKVLLPFLSAVGIALDQIDVEKTLRLRLGRGVHQYVSDTASGRLDLLVRSREGENLFVVELKREDLDLTDDDRDQGISYARLLDQIAPFVLLTNGRESRLYDSISREELKDDIGTQYTTFRGRLTTEDIRIRYEALKHFLGYSAGNVQIFSRCQETERMKGLRGNVRQLDRKYIPELYTFRPQVREAFQRFLAGSGCVFAIVGDSGTGKTNEMCSLAEEFSASRVALFFSAGAIPASLSEVLIDDFNWHFSEQLRAPEIVRRLAAIATKTGQSVLIFVDALDEAPMQAFAQSISEFALHLSSLAGRVQLIVSVKSAEWSRFAEFRGTPSALATSLDRSWMAEDSPDSEPQPFVLTELSEQELRHAEAKYQQVFNLNSLPAGRLRAHCRLPFFLRLVSEVYAGSREALPIDVSESELVREWLRRKLAATADPDHSRLGLIAVARAAYARASTRPNRESQLTLAALERVPEQDIIQELGNSTHSISNDLVAHGILLRDQDERGRVSFAFYYRQVRDYLIASQVLRLDELNAEQFAQHIDTLLSSYVLQGVLSWHLRDAPSSHVFELKKALRGRAMLYVDTYNRIFDELAAGVKIGVEPYTAGPIGMAFDMPSHGSPSYALYPVGQRQQERVIQVSPASGGSSWPFADAVRKFNGHARRGGANFSNSDPQEAGAQFAYEQIAQAIAKGRLDDLTSDELLTEACIAIAVTYRDKLRMPGTRRSLPDETSFPIDMLDKAIQSCFGAEYYSDLWREKERRTENSPYVKRRGSIVTVTMDSDAMAAARQRAETEAQDGARFPAPNVVNDEDFYQVLPEIISRLRARGVQQISPVLPPPDQLIPYSNAPLPNTYSDDQLGKLIKAFFRLSLGAYKDIIERNFPGLRHRFATYSLLPLSVIVQYKRPEHPDTWRNWGEITYAFTPAETNLDEVSVFVDPPEPIFQLHEGEHVGPKGRKLPYGLSWTDLYELFRPANAPGFGRRHSSGYAGLRAPIRAFAYRLVREDFAELTPGDLLTGIVTQ